MPGLSFQEFVCVLLLLLVIVKPKDLPRLCRELGRLYANLQHYLYRIRCYTRENFDAISQLDLPEENSTRSVINKTISPKKRDVSSEIQLEMESERRIARKD